VSLISVVAASLGSAAFFSVSTALRHRSAGQMPRVHHFRPNELLGFAAATLRHPLWLGGILADVGGLGLQVLALHFGSLTVVQPVLGDEGMADWNHRWAAWRQGNLND